MEFPRARVRIDRRCLRSSWESFYDPMIAKILATAESRDGGSAATAWKDGRLGPRQELASSAVVAEPDVSRRVHVESIERSPARSSRSSWHRRRRMLVAAAASPIGSARSAGVIPTTIGAPTSHALRQFDTSDVGGIRGLGRAREGTYSRSAPRTRSGRDDEPAPLRSCDRRPGLVLEVTPLAPGGSSCRTAPHVARSWTRRRVPSRHGGGCRRGAPRGETRGRRPATRRGTLTSQSRSRS